jgi:hypothetical protein
MPKATTFTLWQTWIGDGMAFYHARMHFLQDRDEVVKACSTTKLFAEANHEEPDKATRRHQNTCDASHPFQHTWERETMR